MDAEVAHEIQAAVREHLSRFGVQGEVFVVGECVELRGGGAPVAVELHLLGEQWPLLPPEHRERKVVEVARRLSEAARMRPEAPGAPAALSRVSARGIILVATVVGVVLIVVGVWVRFGAELGLRVAPEPPPPKIPTESAVERDARQARVCEAARKRLFSGASIGPLDTQGWVVELWLLPAADGEDLFQATTSLVTNEGGLSADVDAEMAALAGGRVEIATGLPGGGGREVGTLLRFTGAFTDVFLDPERQGALVRVADAVYERTRPSMGALYARCAHLPNHDVGAWFRGRDAAHTAAAVVFSVGGFVEGEPVSARVTDLDHVTAATAKVPAAELIAAAKGEGSDVTTADEGVTFRFPVAAGTRPIALSRVLSEKVGLTR